MAEIEEKIDVSQEEYDSKCDELDDELVENLEQIHRSFVAMKESFAKKLVKDIIG